MGSWLCAKQAGGEWLLRIDDIDPERECPGAAASILHTLAVFGLHSDRPVVYQSQRKAAYAAAFAQPQADGAVFPCWCSRQNLAVHGGLHRGGRCRRPPQADRPPAWRLRTPDVQIVFEDLSQGTQRQSLRETVGDFVIQRAEGHYSYHLATVLDDAWQGISEVVRGADLIDSTPRQIYLQNLLGLPTPRYRHLALATDADGRKWSKSTGASALDPRHPLPALRASLGFLGQPVPASDDCASLLQAAGPACFQSSRLTAPQQPYWAINGYK